MRIAVPVLTLLAFVYELAFIRRVGPRVEESGAGEDLRLKT